VVALVAVALAAAAIWLSPDLRAIRELGVLAGIRCLQGSMYVYDPRREQADQGLIADKPEQTVLAQAPELEIERVEVQLRHGEAVVSARDSARQRRVFVLLPGHLRSITREADSEIHNVCVSQLGDWRIIGDHALG
jgi:hypothetical protein